MGPVARVLEEAGAPVIGAMHGPTVMLFVFSIAGAIVVAFLMWEKDRDERERDRDLRGVDEWERTKAELAPPGWRR